MAKLETVNAMGQAHNGEAVELNAFMANRAEYWSRVEAAFREAERNKKAGGYKPEYLERDLQSVILTAAAKYVREYCPQSSALVDFFPFATRIATAELITQEFEAELEAGNSWLD